MAPGASGAPEPGAAGTTAVDRSVLGEWLPGDDAAIDALLVTFRDSILVENTRLRSELIVGDLPLVAKTAHRLRGAALAMGASALAAVAATVDAAAQTGDPNACVALLPGLELQIRRMVAEVPDIASEPDLPQPN